MSPAGFSFFISFHAARVATFLSATWATSGKRQGNTRETKNATTKTTASKIHTKPAEIREKSTKSDHIEADGVQWANAVGDSLPG